MPNKTEEYLALACKTADSFSRQWEHWAEFLITAARLYKYSYPDQLMIYAQRPDATACAEYDVWNNKMNRYVRRGSKGIALLDESGEYPRLHYVFDVSDTAPRRNALYPDLWQINESLKEPVRSMLAENYGVRSESFGQQLADVAGKLVQSYWDNNSSDILGIVDGSYLMSYDDAGRELQFKSAAAMGVTYMLLERCGLDPAGWFDEKDFQAVYDFTTPSAVYALGTAVSDCSREVLRQIERTVKTTIRRRNIERSQEEYEQQSELHEDRGLFSAEPDLESAPEAAEPVRKDAPELSDGAAPGGVQHDAAERDPVPAPVGDGTDGRKQDAAADERTVGEEPGSGQGEKPDGVGAAHEQPESAGGGNDPDRADLQLSFLEAAIPTEAQQIESIDQAESEKSSSAFVLSQADIEKALRRGSNFENSKLRIWEIYQTQPDRKLRAKALAKEYAPHGPGGCSHTYLDGSSGWLDHDSKGLTFEHYPDHQKIFLRWNQVEKYIDLMMQADRYLTDKEKSVIELYFGLNADSAAEYNALKVQYPDALVGFEQNGQFEFYGEDARKICELTGGKLLERETALGTVLVTGFPREQWVYRAKQLWECGENIYLAGLNEDGTHHQTKYLRREDYLPVGSIVHMEGREFRVDKVDFDKDSVTLQDMALAELRMPIFREAPLAVVRELYEQEPEPPVLVSDGLGLPGEDSNKLPVSIEVNEVPTTPEVAAAEEGLNEEGALELAGNFRITDEELGAGGPKQKFARNIKAIKTLFTLEQEHRGATAEEQQVLSQYVGWGGLADAFDPDKSSWTKEYAELKGLLSEEEYKAARGSVLNAHYTSPTVIRAIYDALERMGFRTGNILEPSMGVGNFFGMLPESMADSRLYGVELDSITGRIAQKLYLLCSLENLDEQGQLKSKADMFTQRTIRPERVVTSVDSPSEALAVSIGEHGKVDLPYMAELLGTPGEYAQITGELSGVIFKDPNADPADPEAGWQMADEYLSGDVRTKLRTAQLAAETKPEFAVNAEALLKAQPKDLEASEIDVRLGATWLAPEIIQKFMAETFQIPYYMRHSINVKFSQRTAEWRIEGKTAMGKGDIMSCETYGTSRANAYKILEETLNLKDVRIYDTIEDDDGKPKRVLNKRETMLAQQKQQSIKDAFANWIWQDPQRRISLVRQYNELFNSTRPREYNGEHIHFVGMNPEISLREHQRNAIAHVLYGGNTLLAHEVGAGKTFEMAASAMEAKRLGLCQKSLFVVPNHLTEQWAAEFLHLYPNAKLLVARRKDFETANRKKFCARIATGDYDAIIMGHSQFEKIPISRERQERLLYEQIDEITEGIAEVQASGGERFTVKQLERTRKSLEARLEKLQAESRKDDVVTFEQLGVDRLFVDEAHNYKNLFLYTKMRNVAGLSTSDAQKSSDMFAKCRYMDEVTGNRGVIFATGTPVSNSMTELYTMQRYLQYDRLQELNMTHFDCWASRFGETVTALELAPEGTGYRARTRFSKFFNLPELMNLFKEMADIKTADQLNLPTPEVEYHNIVAQPTEHQKEMVQALSKRASEVHKGSVDPSVDNMLKITSDGRKLGLDQRIINQLLPDEPGTKVNQCVDNIVQIWRDGDADKLTQLVFCDISTPQQAASSRKAAKAMDNPTLHALEDAIPLDKPEPAFTVYEDIRQKLIAQGMPAGQIAFIHEANTEVRKKELFSKVRTGQVRVLLGSTQKMGAGTNVQDRLVALHDLDCPWRPGDLAQRKGRIERQGNQNPLVHVYRYVTEGTFDAYLWQTVENKQKFISQIMTSKSPVRSCDDIDETALSYAEIKALCAGDPRIKEKMDLDIDVSRLKLLKANHQSQQYRLEDNLLKYFPEQIEQNKGYIAGFEKDLETLATHQPPEGEFAGMFIRGDTLTDKDNAGAAILEACKEVKGTEATEIGSYRGFTMSLSFEGFHHQLTLKGEMSYKVELGPDARGNLTRIDNALAGMPDRLKAVRAQLDNLYQQQAAAKAELGKPFPQEAELQQKSARLAELNALLDMDGSKAAPQQVAKRLAKSERPSVLDGLKAPGRPGPHAGKKQKVEREVR